MEESATISWKGDQVGTVSNIMLDMWYLDADWQPTGTGHSSKFESLARKLDIKEVMGSPSKGLLADLRSDGSTSGPARVLILLLDNSKISMRMISNATAAFLDLTLITPWQPIDDEPFYENELKKEVTFFHPLRWKKVKAIGKRTDRDDVLFEVLNGRFKYALVHLTHTKERSRKFPATKFYLDWDDVYKRLLLEDHTPNTPLR